ncbi:hypothetical protein chiPu_0005447 [Chiloscyllium punctatum]|uniref:Uncharacterized protein n=1 Tax=Chiloscyllium punctatum TaxID=137246 RepID=A0A401S9H4_CHIPU|nr:hypothetical protein [Chiloscyllium punctatum]
MSSSESKPESNPRKAPVPQFFAKLSTLIEKPEVQALTWDDKGKAVLVNAKLYEEEIKLYGELLPELKNYQRKQRRMLYQYINFDNPEFNILTTTDDDKKEKPIQENIIENKTKVSVSSHPTAQTAGNENKEDSLLRTSPSLSLGTPEKSEPNKSAQVSLDINKMLSICAAPLVPPLSPQPKC